MFDINTLVINIPVRSQGVKMCKVRWPTDAEWTAYMKSRQDVRRFSGRGKSESSTTNIIPSNAALFNAIRQDVDGVPFDDAMIEDVIDRLQEFEFLESECTGETWTMQCTAITTFPVSFELREPTRKQAKLVRDKCFVKYDKFDRGASTYLTTHLGPAGALYDELVVNAVGYSSAVPLLHKFGVVFHLIRAIEREVEEAQELAGER